MESKEDEEALKSWKAQEDDLKQAGNGTVKGPSRRMIAPGDFDASEALADWSDDTELNRKGRRLLASPGVVIDLEKEQTQTSSETAGRKRKGRS